MLPLLVSFLSHSRYIYCLNISHMYLPYSAERRFGKSQTAAYSKEGVCRGFACIFILFYFLLSHTRTPLSLSLSLSRFLSLSLSNSTLLNSCFSPVATVPSAGVTLYAILSVFHFAVTVYLSVYLSLYPYVYLCVCVNVLLFLSILSFSCIGL